MKRSLDFVLPPNPIPNKRKKKPAKVKKVRDILIEKQKRPMKDVAACDEVTAEIIDPLREMNNLPPAENMKDVITRENAEQYKDLHIHSGQTSPEKETGYLQKITQAVGVPRDLPLLDEVRREFAFRYATEYRKKKEWCEIFKISPYTLRNWLQRADVAQYIAKVRRDRNSLMSERLLNLEKKSYAKLDSLLDLDIKDPDNAQIVQHTIRDVLSIMGADINGKGSASKTPAVQIQMQQNQQMINNSDPSELANEIKELNKQLDELSILDGAFEEVK